MFISLTEILSFKRRGVENRMFYIIKTGQKEFLPLEYSILVYIHYSENNIIYYITIASSCEYVIISTYIVHEFVVI